MAGFDKPLQDLASDARAYVDLQVDDLKLKVTKGLSLSLGHLLSLLLVFGLAACSGSSNEPAAQESVIKEAEDGGVFDGRIGETIRTYFFDFRVNEAYLCEDYHGYTPQDGNVLLVVKVDIENLMNSSIPMSDMDFQAQWSDDADTDDGGRL